MKKIKVLHIIPTLSRGGAERCVIDLVRNTSPNFAPEILLMKNIAPFATELDRRPLVCEKRGIFDFGYVRRLARMIQKYSPDIVHTHLWGADFWARLAARRVGVPIVTTEHNLDYGESNLRHYLKRRTTRLVSAHVAASEAIAEYARREYGAGDLKVIRYGIDLNKFSNLPLPEFEDTLQILMLGRLVPQKGHTIALQALAKSGINFHLRIVGDGELRGALMNEAVKLGLSDKVEFVPATNDVQSEYVRAEVFLMPSLWEGLGIVAEEAMVAGRVVVASQVDGLGELMQNGETGYYFPRGNVGRLVEILRMIDGDRLEARAVAIRAREYGMKNFAVAEMVERYEEVYLGLMRDGGGV